MSGEVRRDDGDVTGDAAVTVRYWAALRSAADASGDSVAAGTLAEVLDAVRARHTEQPRFGQVLGICSVLVDEQPVSGDHGAVEVAAGAVVDLLPPFAGG